MILSLVFFTFSFIFYLITALVYVANWFVKKRWLGQIATTMAFVTLFSTTMILIMRAGESGHAPFSNLFESMVLFVWALNIGYLLMEFRYKFKSLGAIIMAIEFIAMLSASLLPYRFKSVEPLNPALQNKWHFMVDFLTKFGLEDYAIGWLDFHVFTTFIGYAAFAISFGIAITYLVKNKAEVKGKKNFLLDRFPDSKMLDELSYIAIAWGFPFLTIGIVTGAIWANEAWGRPWSWDPKETWSAITWMIYASYLHARVTRGWRGRRAAWIAVLGFLAIIFLYWGVSFVLPGLHAYA